jgi:heat shock protein HslJ
MNHIVKRIRRFRGLLCPLLISCVLSACAGGASVKETEVPFSAILGTEWKLAGIRTASGFVRYDRQKLEAEGAGDVYTMQFNGGITGKASPNRYFGPYELGEGHVITIGNMAGTLMANIAEPIELKEHEYFAYLARVNRWTLKDGQLELYTVDSAGHETVLVFISGL